MIQTSLTNLIVFNLSALLGGLAIVWAVKVLRERARERRRHRYQVICGVCGETFTDKTGLDPVTCPGCGRPITRQQVLDL